MTDAEIDDLVFAIDQELGTSDLAAGFGTGDLEMGTSETIALRKFARRLLAIGRAEAFREVLELSNNRVLNDWLRRSLSDEEERAKS